MIDWSAGSIACAEPRVGAGEGERRVVAVEDGDGPARAHDARGLGEHGERVADVADEGVGDGGVEAGVGEVERVRVADGELDAVGHAVVGRERLGDRDEVRALVDSGHGAGEAVARGDRARHDAGAAADLQHRCGARQVDAASGTPRGRPRTSGPSRAARVVR